MGRLAPCWTWEEHLDALRPSVQLLSHAWLCDPTDCSTPGFPVLHSLLELAQTHVPWVSDAIEPSHPLSFPSPAFDLSQHQGLFQWIGKGPSGTPFRRRYPASPNRAHEMHLAFRVEGWEDEPGWNEAGYAVVWKRPKTELNLNVISEKSRSVMSDSLRPHGNSLWNSPGQNTGVGSLSLLQGIFPTKDRTQVSCIAGRFFTCWATREASNVISTHVIKKT